jgi:hypothetical protein
VYIHGSHRGSVEHRGTGLPRNVLNEAKRLNVWNDWNGSLRLLTRNFPKIGLFSDLSKYTGHFACGVLTRKRTKREGCGTLPELADWVSGVLLVSLHVLMFEREFDAHQSPRERASRKGLSRASRCTRRGDVDGTDRHDQLRACV